MRVLVAFSVLFERLSYRPLKNQVLMVEDVREEDCVIEVRAALGGDVMRTLGYLDKALSELWTRRQAGSRHDSVSFQVTLELFKIGLFECALLSPQPLKLLLLSMVFCRPVRSDVDNAVRG